MTFYLFFCTAICLALTVSFADSSNILFFHMAATASHRTSIWPLTEKLANRGHNITYIIPVAEPPFSHPNVEEITPSLAIPIVARINGEMDIKARLNGTLNAQYLEAISFCLNICEAFYQSPEVKEWLSRPNLTYDLIMIDSTLAQCGYGLVHKFKSKHVIFTPALMPQILDAFGVVPESSSVPSILSVWNFPPKPTEMSLIERVKNTLEPLIWYFGYRIFLDQVKPVIEKNMNLSEALPDLREFDKNTSLVMINSNFVDDYSLALPPYFVSYSGLWCSQDKLKNRAAIPKDLDDFIGSSDAIYVSFGTSVLSQSMPEDIQKSFFQAVRNFPELRFLWKWRGPEPEDKPENVLMRGWFPQTDILGDKRVKGFVTQAGRPSTQEALCHGVPMIMVPVWSDQDYNSHRLEFIKASIHLEMESVTNQSLTEAIQEVVYNRKFKRRMTQLSKMYRDRPMDPLEHSLYWVEFVLRHDTSLLKPLGMNQTWYERRLLDVYAVISLSLTIVIIMISFGMIKLIKYFLRCGKAVEKIKIN